MSYIRNASIELRTNPELQVLFLAFAGIWFVNDLYRQVIPLLFKQMGISPAVLGLAWSTVAVTEVVFSPITGVIADKYDRMGIGSIACFALTILFSLFYVAQQLTVIVVLMIGVGAGQLLLGNTATATVSEELPDQISGIGWGLRDAFIYLGSGFGLATGGILIASTDSTRIAFLAFCPIMLLLGILFARRGTFIFDLSFSIKDVHFVSLSNISANIREVSDQPILRKFLLVQALVSLGMGGTMFLLPVFAVDIGLGQSRYLIIFAVSNLVGIVMSLIGGLASNVIPKKHLYVTNFIVEAAMLLMFAITTNIFFFGVAMSLFVIQTIFEPAVVGFFFDQFDDEEAARAWSIDGVVSKSASIIAPALGGVIYAIDPRITFATGGLLTGIAALVGATIPRGD